MSKTTFKDICAIAAAMRCYNDGQTVKEIALSAKKSPAVIRKWLRIAGVTLRKK